VTTVYPTGTFPATFVGGGAGAWKIDGSAALAGEPLPAAERLEVRDGIATTTGGVWRLSGVAGHPRYVERQEKTRLDAASPPLGRPEATMAALIPIRKSAAWWSLPQDERRAIFEQRSRHIADSMAFLPRIARRLYHARDLGQPFDFLTWFEFAPEHARAFDDLVAMLRSREEWTFVEREIDIRLSR
jgi:chlorite dismutase